MSSSGKDILYLIGHLSYELFVSGILISTFYFYVLQSQACDMVYELLNLKSNVSDGRKDNSNFVQMQNFQVRCMRIVEISHKK